MTTTIEHVLTEEPIIPVFNTEKNIEAHILAATHYEEAAKHHNDAAKHHTEEKHDKAFRSTVKAHRHSWYARKFEMEDTEQHALVNFHNTLISHILI